MKSFSIFAHIKKKKEHPVIKIYQNGIEKSRHKIGGLSTTFLTNAYCLESLNTLYKSA